MSQHTEFYKSVIQRFGLAQQVDMAIEEMSELILTLCHHRRARVRRDDVISELADVKIMVDQLSVHFGEELVNKEVERKLNRLKTYMTTGEYNRDNN